MSVCRFSATTKMMFKLRIYSRKLRWTKKVLTRIVQDLLLRFRRIKWKLNEGKCVLTPTRKLVFLCSNWHGAGVTRQEEATSGALDLLEILEARDTPLGTKEKQIMAGFLNYYLQFAGKIHTIVQRLVETSGVDMARASFLARFLRSQKYTSSKNFIKNLNSFIRVLINI